VILAFPGSGSNAEPMVRVGGWNETADQPAFIVASSNS
jgi:poly(3-hydroxybutyrate) depolymerase